MVDVKTEGWCNLASKVHIVCTYACKLNLLTLLKWQRWVVLFRRCVERSVDFGGRSSVPCRIILMAGIQEWDQLVIPTKGEAEKFYNAVREKAVSLGNSEWFNSAPVQSLINRTCKEPLLLRKTLRNATKSEFKIHFGVALYW